MKGKRDKRVSLCKRTDHNNESWRVRMEGSVEKGKWIKKKLVDSLEWNYVLCLSGSARGREAAGWQSAWDA